MAPPPPPISPFAQSNTEQLISKLKTKALRLVSPEVKRFLHDSFEKNSLAPDRQNYHLKQANPLLYQKRLENTERFKMLRGNRMNFGNRGLGHRKQIIESLAENNNITISNSSLKANNKTGLNIHRFRPGRWTNVFSRGTRRRPFQFIDAESASNQTTGLADENVAQIDLLKQNANNTFNTATNTTKGKYMPGPRRRYGYKNFKLVPSNSTEDASNSTKLRSENDLERRNCNLNLRKKRRNFKG